MCETDKREWIRRARPAHTHGKLETRGRGVGGWVGWGEECKCSGILTPRDEGEWAGFIEDFLACDEGET